jgi:hypothetical protein
MIIYWVVESQRATGKWASILLQKLRMLCAFAQPLNNKRWEQSYGKLKLFIPKGGTGITEPESMHAGADCSVTGTGTKAAKQCDSAGHRRPKTAPSVEAGL